MASEQEAWVSFLTIVIYRALKEKFQNANKFATSVYKLQQQTDEENQKISWYAEIVATKVHNVFLLHVQYIYVHVKSLLV